MTGDLIQIHDERVIEVKTGLKPLEEEGYIVGEKAVSEEQIAKSGNFKRLILLEDDGSECIEEGL